jgi:hypothetical protein
MKSFKSIATREEENHARMAKPRLSSGLARHFFMSHLDRLTLVFYYHFYSPSS